jgi:hypothetical protein
MTKVEAYIECHYFSSGFKSVFIGNDKRPSFLPNADSVGLSNEIQLKNPDFAVEVTRRDNGRNLTWIGVYKSSVDLDYGDRGNYCGIGVWLVDCSPIHTKLLIESLLGLCVHIENVAPSKAFISGVEEFHRDYLGQYLLSNDLLPTSFSGLPYFKDRYNSNKYICIDSNTEFGLSVLTNSIRSNLFTKQDNDHNRILYLVGNLSKLSVSSLSDVNPLVDIAKLESLFANMLSYNSDAVLRDKINDQKNIELLKINSDLSQENRVIKEELAKHLSTINDLKIKISDLQNKLNKLELANVKSQQLPSTSNVKSSLPSNDISKLAAEISRLTYLIQRLESYEHNKSPKIQNNISTYQDEEHSNSDGKSIINFLKQYQNYIYVIFTFIVLAVVAYIINDQYRSSKVSHTNPEAVDINSEHGNNKSKNLGVKSSDSQKNVQSELPTSNNFQNEQNSSQMPDPAYSGSGHRGSTETED